MMPKTVFEKGESAGEMRRGNPEEFNPQLGNTRYHVERTIYIFSVAKREFSISSDLFPGLTLRGCANGERFVLAATVADPVAQACLDLERGGRRIDYHDGWMCAVGLLNPESTSRDPFIGAEGASVSVGNNYIAQGLFPSWKNPPEESDIRKAESFRDRRFKRLTDEAFRAAAKSSRALSDFLHQHEDVHDAMDALRLTADWHQKSQVLAKCPNCGDDIPSSVAFHKSSTGILCVLDPDRAFKAGAIDRARMEDLMTAP
jgi:hypothetical protein